MADKKSTVEADRRSFLKLAGLGGVAGSVTLLAGETAEAAETSTSAVRSGYVETEHVKAFYRTARF
jgi:hypothetical protein